MSELFLGLAVFAGASAFAAGSAVGMALYRLFQKAGVPFESSLLSHVPALSTSSLMTEWHRVLSKAMSLSCQSLPSREASALKPLVQAKALEAALTQMPLLHHIVQHTDASLLQQARTVLQQAEQARLDGRWEMAKSHALTAKQLLEEAVFNAHERLAQAQQIVLSEAVSQSLQELGYKVSQHQNEQGVALWGVKGGQGIAVVVSKDGSLQMDMLGFDGLSCQGERQRLLAKLAERGITVQQRTSFVHGRRSGGQLLQNALRLARQRNLSVPRALLDTALPKRPSQERLRERQWLVWGQKIRL